MALALAMYRKYTLTHSVPVSSNFLETVSNDYLGACLTT